MRLPIGRASRVVRREAVFVFLRSLCTLALIMRADNDHCPEALLAVMSTAAAEAVKGDAVALVEEK